MEKRNKLIIFDLDGTLIDSLPVHLLAFKDLLREHGIKADHRYLKKIIGMTTSDILRDLKRKHKFNENIQALREERRYHYFKFLGNRKILFLGVRQALKKLKLKYKIAIATGSSKVVFSHSTDKSFQDMFDTIVTANDVKRGKPNPSQLLLAARRTNVRPGDCIVVGDSIYDGIAARRARMHFIGVTTGFTSKRLLMENGAKRTVRSIRELAKIL